MSINWKHNLRCIIPMSSLSLSTPSIFLKAQHTHSFVWAERRGVTYQSYITQQSAWDFLHRGTEWEPTQCDAHQLSAWSVYALVFAYVCVRGKESTNMCTWICAWLVCVAAEQKVVPQNYTVQRKVFFSPYGPTPSPLPSSL